MKQARKGPDSKGKIRRLNKLFDNQLETLKRLGVPIKIIHLLDELRDNVIVTARDIRTNPNRIPFVPVISPPHCSLEELMKMMGWSGDERDLPPLNPEKYPVVSAVGSEPGLRMYFDPYYIIDIEDGRSTKHVYVLKACRKISANKRSPLTVTECIALAIHTDVLTRHGLWAAGSRWLFYAPLENEIPLISRDKRLQREAIEWCREWTMGTPSCRRRTG